MPPAALIYHATQRLISLLPAFSLDLPIARKRHEPGTVEPHNWLPSDPETEDDDDGSSNSDEQEGEDGAGRRRRYPRPGRKEFRWKKLTSLTGGGVGQLPEVMLAAAVVVVLKMVYPLDKEGEAGDGGEVGVVGALAGVVPGQGAWLRAVRAAGEVGDGVGDLGRLWKGEVEEMTGEEVDDYLDFVERTVVPPSRLPKRMTEVDRHFPAPALPDSATSQAQQSGNPSLSALIDDLFASTDEPPAPNSTAPATPAPPPIQLAHYPPTPSDAPPLTLLPFPPALGLLLSSAAAPVGLTAFALSNPVGAIEHLLAMREREAGGGAGSEGTNGTSGTKGEREGVEERRREWQRAAREGRRGRDKEELGRRRAIDRMVRKRRGLVEESGSGGEGEGEGGGVEEGGVQVGEGEGEGMEVD